MIEINRLEDAGRMCYVYGAAEKLFERCGVRGPWERAVFNGRPEGNQAKSATVMVEVDGTLVEGVLLAAEAGGETAIEFPCGGGVLRGKGKAYFLGGTATTRLFRGRGGFSPLQPKQVITLAERDALNFTLGFAVVLFPP